MNKSKDKRVTSLCLNHVSSAVRKALMGSVLLSLVIPPVHADLPVQCRGACGASGLQWRGMGDVEQPRLDGNTLVIEQHSDQAILNWQSFNIGRNNAVHFDQPDASAVTLNRIYQGSPSQILGRLSADGQVYLINPNGVLFGEGAQVDVRSLVASTLDVSDAVFEAGILSAIQPGNTERAAFIGNGETVVVDADGSPVLFAVDGEGTPLRDVNGFLIPDPLNGQPMTVSITTENGAVIETQDGGSVLMFAPEINNGGLIHTPDGQTILAAGDKIYIQRSDDPQLRGLLVEVDTGGSVSNLGSVIAERGNISMLGLAVNQQGLARATTSVNVNGSIRLLARDSVVIGGGSSGGSAVTMNTTRTGEVVLGEDSHTEVLAELDSVETAVDDQQQYASSVELMGRSIHLQANSEIVANSGVVDITALNNPNRNPVSNEPVPRDDAVRVQMDTGSRIDVSGNDVTLEMSRNLLEVELRGNELRDAPLQRDGALRGETVTIDIRTLDESGRIPLADVSGGVNNIKRDVAERTTEGGSVSLLSEGDVVMQTGAGIDVSGGSVRYNDGITNTTKLVSEGRIYDISSADPDRRYDGILANGRPERQAGYVEGKDAGQVQFAARGLVLDGDLTGGVVRGPYQREMGQQPQGGLLTIGLPYRDPLETRQTIENSALIDFRAPSIYFGATGSGVELGRDDALPGGSGGGGENGANLRDQLTLSTAYIEEGGFTRTQVYSNGRIEVAADTPIEVAPGGQFQLTGRDIDVQADITVPAGDIALTLTNVDDQVELADLPGAQQRLQLGDGVTLNASGLWTNDMANQTHVDINAPVLPDGGSIALVLDTAGALALGDDVSMDVSAGAWLQANGDLQAGKGGDISITTDSTNATVDMGADLSLRGMALSEGGTLYLTLPELEIAGAMDSAGLQMQEELWRSRRQSGSAETFAAALVGQLEAGSEASFDDVQRAQLREEFASTIRDGWQINASLNLVDLRAELTVAMDTALAGGSSAALGVALDQALQHETLGGSVSDRLTLPSEMFQQGGFADYQLTANRGGLTVLSDAEIRPRMQNFVLSRDYRSYASGAELAAFTQTDVLLPSERRSVDISLNLDVTQNVSTPDQTRNLLLQQGSEIITDPGARVAVASETGGRIVIEGVIHAPAGDIDVTLKNNQTQDFNSYQMIWLGTQSELSTQGVTLLEPDPLGRRIGEVLDAGSISMSSAGYIMTANGSSMDVSAVSTILDIADGLGLRRQQVAGAAGDIRLNAAEGILLDGELRGAGTTGAGPQGGSLAINIDRDLSAQRAAPVSDLNQSVIDSFGNAWLAPRQLLVRQSEQAEIPQAFNGSAISDTVTDTSLQDFDAALRGAGLNGQAIVSAQQINDGGFDQLTLKNATGEIRFEGDVDAGSGAYAAVDLVLDRGLQLSAPVLATEGGDVNLEAPYITLGGIFTGGNAQGGDAAFTVTADFIDLAGSTVLHGFEQTQLNAAGDIRLRGQAGNSSQHAQLVASGALSLSAAQVYGATLADFTLRAEDIPADSDTGAAAISSSINIASTGVVSSNAVLSAGARLTLEADTIRQGGVLKAPFGEVTFNAGQQLTLSVGSVTSTSGEEQQVPFGRVQNGVDWYYFLASDNINNAQRIFAADGQNLPQQRINLNGEQVDIATGAQLDMRGGGDLYAYEWIPGPGGSVDALAAKYAVNTFAILPQLAGATAPYDPQEYRGWDLQPGDSVRLLSDAAGLAAGEYALLPARYALLPGAYLVTATSSYDDLQPGQQVTLLDGAPVVAGYRTVAGTDIRDGRNSGFVVRPGDYARQIAEYRDFLASDFVPQRAEQLEIAVPRLPTDAGSLVIAGQTAITLEGELLAAAADGGNGARVDIIADDLRVVDETNGASGAVELSVNSLNNLGAESLLLGGRRSEDADGTHLVTESKTVTVASGVTLAAPELMLTASETVAVETGATLEARAVAQAESDNINEGRRLVLEGDSSLLSVSSTALVDFRRTGTASGRLDIAAGAVLRAGRSMILDAFDTQSAGAIEVLGSTLSLGASRISLGDEVDAGLTGGLVFDQQQLDSFSGLDLQLHSLSSLDLYGPVTVAAQNLVIEAGAVVGHQQQGGTATLQATEMISFSNPQGVIAAGSVIDEGSLQVSAQQIVLGEGEIKLQGFSNVSLEAQRDIVGQGKGGLQTSADLVLSSARLTGETGAETRIVTAGHVNILAAPGADLPDILSDIDSSTDGIGARLSISGSGIEHGGRIQLASGGVELHAAGSNVTDSVILLEGSEIDVSGRSLTFADREIGTPGGRVSLRADAGDVTQQAGALIDVSGVAEGGGSDAGTLSIIATQGELSLQGDVRGTAQAAYRSGVFDAHARAIGDGGFTALNQVLNSGGFAEQRALRIGNGDVVINDVVTTHDFRLTTDSGAITLGGTIDASGVDGGRVEMFARDELVLTSAARIDASSSAEGEEGGQVTLGTTQGYLSFDKSFDASTDGSQRPVIDVSAGEGGVGGDVQLRASRARQAQYADGSLATDANGRPLFIIDDAQGNALFPIRNADGVPVDGQGNAVFDSGSNNTVAIAALDADIVGASGTVVEAVRVYEDADGTITASDISTAGNWYIDAANFMSQAAAIRTQLGVATDDSNFHLAPGLEIRSDADLTLDTDWDFVDWRFGGEPGVLTLRAGENLRINSDLNDGFRQKTIVSGFTSTTINELLSDRSWSYRLTGGADMQGASPVALVAADQIVDGVGNVALGNGSRVRTGTGDIDVAAAGDLTFGDQQSLMYTAGTPSGWELDRAWLDAPDPGTPAKYLPTGGGDLRIVARGDVIGPGTATDKTQLIDEWLPRQQAAEENIVDLGFITLFLAPEEMAGWWIDYDNFQQNLAAFGGGDLEIIAGGDITRLSASVPTTGALDKISGGLQRVGRGDLYVDAGGDILSGIFFVGDGQGSITAQGALGSARHDTFNSDNTVDTVLALMGGQMDVRAQDDLRIQATINPTLLRRQNGIEFVTFDMDSSLRAQSLTGDVELRSNGLRIEQTTSTSFKNTADVAHLYPGNVNLTALQGDVAINESSALLSSPQGNLELFAGEDIQFGGAILMSDSNPNLLPGIANPSTTVTGVTKIFQDARRQHMATPLHEDDMTTAYVVARTGNVEGNSQPLQIPKQTVMSAGHNIDDVQLDVQHVRASDVTRIEAGRDIVQRGASSVITVSGPGHVAVSAGRNIDLGPSKGIETTGNLSRPALPEGGAGITVSVGLGDSTPDYTAFLNQYQNRYFGGSPQQQSLLDYMATRSGGRGLTSVELLDDFMQLPATDQTTILTELGLTAEDHARMEVVLRDEINIAAFVDEVRMDSGDSQISTHQQAVVTFNEWSSEHQQALRESLGLEAADIIDVIASIEFRDELVQYTNVLSDSSLTAYSDSLAMFNDLDPALQRPMIEQMFYRELRSTGRQANARGDADFSRGYDAVATLFPDSEGTAYEGDLSLFFSKIYTVAGGDINLLVPGGLVNAGLANQPANAPDKKPSELGIVAQGLGRVNAFTDGDFLVNQSRVFSLQGGDILMWSSESNIDAGRGTKTAISAPPPQITIDDNGQVQVSFANAIAGSGIRAISTDSNRNPGDVDLIAPRGVVDAGDAGIGGENLNIAAQQVIGADNIDIGGISSGVPVSDSGALSGGLTGTSDVSNSASKSAGDAVAGAAGDDMSDTPLADAALSYLEVTLLGLGEEEDEGNE